jgi:hypothetical protein
MRKKTLLSGKGQLLPSEYRKLVDEQTGATVHHSLHPSINHHLYFPTDPPLPWKSVVFTSYRDGQGCLTN